MEFFFATSHGKRPCDGISGTIKRLVACASLQATKEGQILIPMQLYSWANKRVTGIKVIFVTKQDIAEHSLKIDAFTICCRQWNKSVFAF